MALLDDENTATTKKLDFKLTYDLRRSYYLSGAPW